MEIQVAVRNLVVKNGREFCIACQKPNKTRYVIVDKDNKPASAYFLAHKFYGLPFAKVDQNKQTYMCRMCFRAIQKYYKYTEKAKQIKETLQKSSAKLETVVVFKSKESFCNDKELKFPESVEKIQLSDSDENEISTNKICHRSYRTRSCSNKTSKIDFSESNQSVQLTSVQTKSTSPRKRSLELDTDTEICSPNKVTEKEQNELNPNKCRILENTDQMYTRSDVVNSLQKLENPKESVPIQRLPTTRFSCENKKRIREVKYRSLFLAEMFESAVKSLADGSVRKAVKMIARVNDEAKRKDFLDAIDDLVNAECKMLEKKENSKALRYSSVDEIKFDNMLKEVKCHCPVLWSCLVAAANGNICKPDVCDNKVIAAVAILLQNRNANINAFQTFLSLMAREYHIKKEGLHILNQFGITLSSKTTYSRIQKSETINIKKESEESEGKEQEHNMNEHGQEEEMGIVVDHTYCTQEETEIENIQIDKIQEFSPISLSAELNSVNTRGVERGCIQLAEVQATECVISPDEKADLLQQTLIELPEGQTIVSIPQEYLVNLEQAINNKPH